MILAIICSLLCVSLQAKNEGEFFLQANQLYAQGQYKNACDVYDKITNKGSAVWYNMGACSYQLEDFAHARLFWERAQVGASKSMMHHIRAHHQMIDDQLGFTVQATLLGSVADTLLILVTSSSLLFLQLCLLIFLYLFFFLTRKNMVKKFYAGVLGICCMVSGLLVLEKYISLSKKRAVVMKKDSVLHAGPDARYHIVGNLYLAQTVEIKQAVEGWYKVSAKEKTGWVLADSLIVV